MKRNHMERNTNRNTCTASDKSAGTRKQEKANMQYARKSLLGFRTRRREGRMDVLDQDDIDGLSEQ